MEPLNPPQQRVTELRDYGATTRAVNALLRNGIHTLDGVGELIDEYDQVKARGEDPSVCWADLPDISRGNFTEIRAAYERWQEYHTCSRAHRGGACVPDDLLLIRRYEKPPEVVCRNHIDPPQ